MKKSKILGLKKCLWILIIVSFYGAETALADFVVLPKEGFSDSAYILCDTSGDFGMEPSSKAKADYKNSCVVTSPALEISPMNAPLEGFNLVGMLVRDIPMPAPYAGKDDNVATLTDTIWGNSDKTECIYGTHLQMKPAPLADGVSWEVNDIARGGFKGMPLEVAYFYKSNVDNLPVERESVFRIGRTFTSVRHSKGDIAMPVLKNAPASNKAITVIQAAAVSENWVNFTTDLNTNDPDGSSRPVSSMMYIKTTCSTEPPVTKDDAIRLRTTGQNGQHMLEVTVPGLVPAGANVDTY